MADISTQSAKVASRARRVEANPSTDDFSFDIWRQIFRTIARNEKKAMDTWETVHFEIEVTEREVHLPNKISILKMQLVCEPGKQARLDLDQLSRPRKKSHCYASCVLATPRMANKNARAFEINGLPVGSSKQPPS